MSSQPSGAFTFHELIKRVAEKLGIANYRSNGILYVPYDQYNFSLCRQYVNNGIKMFMADAPRKGWRWMRRICQVTFATRVTGIVDSASATTLVDLTLASTYTTTDELKNWWIYVLTGTGIGSHAQITSYNKTTGSCGVAAWLDIDGNLTGTTPAALDTFAVTSVRTDDGNATKYILPANFSGTVDGPIKYTADSSHSTEIEWCDESLIRSLQSSSVSSGYPSLAAIRPYQPMDENLCQSRLWEMIVDLQPTAEDVVEFPYTLHFDDMKMEVGIATGGTAATLIDTARWEADDYFNGWTIEIVNGTGVGETAVITDYTKSTSTFAFTALSSGSTPGTTSVYIVYPRNNLHPAGHQFDDTILAVCLARTEIESQDEHFDTTWTTYYQQKALPNAYRVDMRSAPRKLGYFGNGPTELRRRSWNDVVTDHDI